MPNRRLSLAPSGTSPFDLIVEGAEGLSGRVVVTSECGWR